MKKQKLTLKDLKVKSFVTKQDEMNKQTLKGGAGTHYDTWCDPKTCPEFLVPFE